jgi:Coenzyme PQQ synthesis protein D (PqqD)
VNDGTLLQRSSDVLTRSFAGEVLVTAAEGGGVVDRLTGPAVPLWKLLEEGRTLGDLIAIVANAYGAAEDVVARDVEPFVRGLIERGWVLEILDADD